jgi:hypothetical protein
VRSRSEWERLRIGVRLAGGKKKKDTINVYDLHLTKGKEGLKGKTATGTGDGRKEKEEEEPLRTATRREIYPLGGWAETSMGVNAGHDV